MSNEPVSPLGRAVWVKRDDPLRSMKLRLLDSSEQMMNQFYIYDQSALDAVRDAALEEAANVCEKHAEDYIEWSAFAELHATAFAIRALKKGGSDD